MNIAKKIIELREAKGWSQYKLYKSAGISQSNISRIEAGLIIPKGDTLQKIAKALGVSMAEFDENTPVKELFPQVIEQADHMTLDEKEQIALDRLLKMPTKEQQELLTKVLKKFQSLPAEHQKALALIIDSLGPSEK
ncbi:MAG: putative transcriptional regulator, family [Firmicutes bacterium]|nr:putative transcriptional regulator, family [Bacillota bacterium]